jgi:hypothetical protein
MWDCVLGAGNGEGNTLVAPLWRRRCERGTYTPIAPLRRRRRDRVTGWAWTGGALMPRHHSDQDQHRQNGHSRLRASWLATGHGSQPPLGIMAGPRKRYCRPARPSAEPSRPHRLAVARPTGYSTGGGLRNWVIRGGRGTVGANKPTAPGSPAPRKPRRPAGGQSYGGS